MKNLSIGLKVAVAVIGLYMIIAHGFMTPPFVSGVAFVLIAASLYLNCGCKCGKKCSDKKGKKNK